MAEKQPNQTRRQKSVGAPGPLTREAVKPFELVKNFTFTSLIVIFAATIVLSVVITHRARTVLLQKSEEYAVLLANNLNHQVFLQFIIPTALQFGRIQLRNKVQFQRMDRVVRATLHGFKVDMVNIYDLENVISYSFDPELVGKADAGGVEYLQAMEGKTTSRLDQGGSWLAVMLGIPEHSRLRTYTPLLAEKPMTHISGPVLGVFEVVQDLSDDYRTIFQFQLLIIATSAGVMGLLFLIMRWVVQRGEAVILMRAEERIRLEEQLSHAERLASLGEMAAGVSHEIRNPLGIIRSTAELLRKRSGDNNGGGPLVDVIIEESTRLNDIVTDFLNFARPQNPRFQVCNLAEVVEKNISYLEPRLDKEKCRITTEFDPATPLVKADPNLLYQSFLNILINAMQAMPEGGNVTVSLFPNGDKVCIHFADEGKGVDEAAMKKIWNPFFTTKESGTGLGLCMVRNIVEAHNGSVWIENRPVIGASVKIELPLEEPSYGDDTHS
ncbi:MAG: two-component system sensor histidine kinase NtrB [Desulfatibacillaceae bacterium]